MGFFEKIDTLAIDMFNSLTKIPVQIMPKPKRKFLRQPVVLRG
jgi:hypothetical protein